MNQMVNKEVVIVAGPSASGKSHLLKRLMNKKRINKFRDKIYQELNIDPLKSRSCITIGALAKPQKKTKHSNKLQKDIIFIHFDTTSRRKNKKRQLLLSIAANCSHIRILTIHTDFETWRSRMQERFKSNPNEVPQNKSTEIYKLSIFSCFFARRRFNFSYKKWHLLINDINPQVNLVIKNDEIPFNRNKQKQGSKKFKY